MFRAKSIQNSNVLLLAFYFEISLGLKPDHAPLGRQPRGRPFGFQRLLRNQNEWSIFLQNLFKLKCTSLFYFFFWQSSIKKMCIIHLAFEFQFGISTAVLCNFKFNRHYGSCHGLCNGRCFKTIDCTNMGQLGANKQWCK